MCWSELDGTNWELPSSRTKAKRPHRVPLSPLALSLIGEPQAGEHVFINGGRPVHVNTPGDVMQQSLKILGLSDNPATPHDLRRSFASGMGDLGIPPHVVGRLLNHSLPSITERVYYLTAMAPEKERAMLQWSNKLLEITTGKVPEKVTPIRGAVG